MTSPNPGMPSSFGLDYHLPVLARVGPCCDDGDTARRLNDAPSGSCTSRPQARRYHCPREQSWAWDPISERHRSVSMTQQTTDVDERIAALRSRIAEQLLHIQRLNDLGRDFSDASEVLDLMLSALAQMKEVKKTIRALERAS